MSTETLEILAAFIVGMQTLLIIMILVMHFKLRRRYERLRNDIAEAFGAVRVRLDDHDMRLVAAGFPPGRVLPMRDQVFPIQSEPVEMRFHNNAR